MDTNQALKSGTPSHAALRSTTGAPTADPGIAVPPATAPAEPGGHRARGRGRPLFEPAIVRRAIVDSLRKLDPRHQVRNPVMFVVEVGSVLTTCLFVQAL